MCATRRASLRPVVLALSFSGRQHRWTQVAAAVRIFCGRRRNPLRSYAALEPRVDFTDCACVDKGYRGRDAPNPCPVVCAERSDETRLNPAHPTAERRQRKYAICLKIPEIVLSLFS